MKKVIRPAKGNGVPSGAAMVYEHLRQEIITLQLAPGTHLNRTALQARFGLSSTPVRDALNRLGEEHLVETFAQSATRVSLIDIAEARRAQFLRRALEQEAAETICNSPDRAVIHDLNALIAEHKAVAAMPDPGSAHNLAAFNAIDQRFHQCLFEAAGVASLHAMIRRQSGHIDRIRQLHLPQTGRLQEIIADHEAIAQAIKAGDATGARLAVRNHLSRSLAYSPRLRDLHPSYFAL